MRVDDIMNKHVQTCRPDDSLQFAAQLMWDHDCGCVPVCGSHYLREAATSTQAWVYRPVTHRFRPRRVLPGRAPPAK